MSSDAKKPWQRDSNDGTSWMTFTDFVRLFTTVCVCRLFPDDQYRQYCIHGEEKKVVSCNSRTGLQEIQN